MLRRPSVAENAASCACATRASCRVAVRSAGHRVTPRTRLHGPLWPSKRSLWAHGRRWRSCAAASWVRRRAQNGRGPWHDVWSRARVAQPPTRARGGGHPAPLRRARLLRHGQVLGRLLWDLSDVVYTRVIHKGDRSAKSQDHSTQVDILPPNPFRLWMLRDDATLYTAFVQLHEDQRRTILDSTFEKEAIALSRIRRAVEDVCKTAQASDGMEQNNTMNRITRPRELDLWCNYANADEAYAEHRACRKGEVSDPRAS